MINRSFFGPKNGLPAAALSKTAYFILSYFLYPRLGGADGSPHTAPYLWPRSHLGFVMSHAYCHS